MTVKVRIYPYGPKTDKPRIKDLVSLMNQKIKLGKCGTKNLILILISQRFWAPSAKPSDFMVAKF